MTSWSGGYVADVAYIEGFYGQQSPSRMALACLIGNVAVDLPGPDDPAHYLELGCGRGMGALLIAASNPGWRVTAIDYNPAHIAIGRAVARSAGLTNLHFLETDLAALAGSEAARRIPQADFVSLHGVWSWVGPDVRAGIVRLLGEKTCPGGLVHVSYNALPAWQGGLGLQRLIYEAGVRTVGRSDRQAAAGLALARDINEAAGQYLSESGLARELLARTGQMSLEYMSHEYMNTYWAPAFHADVAAAMGQAKLDWVASANPLENFPELMLSDAQRGLLDRFDDPIMRELIKDMCLPRQLRHDVFVRGARRLSNAGRDAAIGQLTIAPLVSPAELVTSIPMPAGLAEMSETLKDMMAASLQGPATIADLLARAPGRSSPAELAGALVGSQQGQILARPGAAQPASADRLNRYLGARVTSLAGAVVSGALASGQLGTGLMTAPVVQFIAARLLGGEREDAAETWIETLRADLPPDRHETVRSVVRTTIEQRIPLLRQLGIVPP